MHRSRKFYNTTTAKLEIDEEVCKQRDNGRKVGILNTDLTAGYQTVSLSLLLNKLEHVGFRGEEWKLMSSYLENKKFYTDVQGFTS